LATLRFFSRDEGNVNFFFALPPLLDGAALVAERIGSGLTATAEAAAAALSRAARRIGFSPAMSSLEAIGEDIASERGEDGEEMGVTEE